MPDSGYIYFTRHLPIVQKLDFCLIIFSRKTEDPLEPCTDWLQATYQTSSAIRQVLSPLSLHDRNNEMVEEFIYKSTMHKTLTADDDEL